MQEKAVAKSNAAKEATGVALAAAEKHAAKLQGAVVLSA